MLIDYYLGETTGSAAAVAQPPCRVLLVDDDEMPRTRLAAQLRLAHYDVHTARTGEDALRFVRETPCQIVRFLGQQLVQGERIGIRPGTRDGVAPIASP